MFTITLKVNNLLPHVVPTGIGLPTILAMANAAIGGWRASWLTHMDKIDSYDVINAL